MKTVDHFFKQFFIIGILTTFFILCNERYAYGFQQDPVVQKSIDATQKKETDEKQKVEVSTTAREELHRYMGYEELLPRYVSLPYDVNMQTNISGPFVDISYLFLLFLPILLLYGLKNRLLKIVVGLLMIIFLVISIPTGYNSSKLISFDDIGLRIAIELKKNTFSEAPIAHLKLQITELAYAIYKPIYYGIVDKFSGEGDSITYPILFLFFLLSFYLVNNRLKETSFSLKAMSYFFLMTCFLWLILGSGVIWYGNFILPLGLILMGIGALKLKTDTKFLKYTFLTIVVIWLVNSLAYRFSNYSYPLTYLEISNGAKQSKMNTAAIHAGPLLYGLGRKNKSEMLEFLFPAYNSVAQVINNDPDAIVYRIGTYFQYFIEGNNKRVVEDNQLARFDAYDQSSPYKQEKVKLLKKLGYKYIIVDFNVATIDKTPDKTLIRKSKALETFLQNNSGLEMIGTDRIIMNRQGQKKYGVLGGKVVEKGTFVAFRIK